MLTVGSLFSGIGGIDLGLERAGFKIKWQVEIDEYCRKVLTKHWPTVPKYRDIRDCGAHNLESVDLVCGGFPCQPFSHAGKRKGKEDDRYLWPEMLRVISELKPRWVLGENVAGIVNMGLDVVLSDLEGEGYETGTFVIPACAVYAPHRRDRVWILAYRDRRGGGTEPYEQQEERAEVSDRSGAGDVAHARSERRQQIAGSASCDEGENERRSEENHHFVTGNGKSRRTGDVAYADDDRCSRTRIYERQRNKRERTIDHSGDCEDVAYAHDAERKELRGAEPIQKEHDTIGRGGEDDSYAFLDAEGSAQGKGSSRLKHGVEHDGNPLGDDSGNLRWWAVEPAVGRVAHGIPRRVDRLKGLGNAVVPQIPEILGRLILRTEKLNQEEKTMAIICDGCGEEIKNGPIFITGEADVENGVLKVNPDLVTTYHSDCVE